MKKLRTNSGEVREAIRSHLIEIAQNDEVKVETVDEAINYIVDRFKVEALRFRRDGESYQKLFTDWLNGLALNTYYYTEDIINFLNGIGLHGRNEYQEATKAADLYHYLIFKEVKDYIIK